MAATAFAPPAEQRTGASEISELEPGLISNARRRQRRRRVAALSFPVIAVLAGLLIASAPGGRSGQHATGARSRLPVITHEPASRAFAQAPYMGVACHAPNRISCDRIGLAVWLRRPATVTASIAGKRLKLNNPTWSYVARPGHLYVYAGFLQPAGLTTSLGVVPASKWTNSWLGADAPSPLVRFQIDYGGTSIVSAEQHVYLSAGWG